MTAPQIAYGAAFCIFFFLFGKKAYIFLLESLRAHRRQIVQGFDQSNMLLQRARTEYEALLVQEENMSKHLEELHRRHEEELSLLKEQHITELKNNKEFYVKKKAQQEKIMEQEYKKKLLTYQWGLLEERLKNGADHHREESMEILLKGSKRAMATKCQIKCQIA